MSALAQQTRLAVFEQLMQVHPRGIPAGELAVTTATSPNTMSSHLAILSRAGLVASSRSGRNIIYSACPASVLEASAFLTSIARKTD